ncbi:unnamed protein product [Strongylus vulgaris]|uniref:Uncharacterized protein n=1 Tax=Strongylus vulgaris TaxID=40348 RepID=A0A3P7I6D4_STRVU|nr:unnamed protein product [Strongylus vulgaris]
MLRTFVLFGACLATLDLSYKPTPNQKKAEIEERIKHLMDMKFLIPPKDSERIEIKLDKEEELPEEYVELLLAFEQTHVIAEMCLLPNFNLLGPSVFSSQV